jgi:hypothetical protein
MNDFQEYVDNNITKPHDATNKVILESLAAGVAVNALAGSVGT